MSFRQSTTRFQDFHLTTLIGFAFIATSINVVHTHHHHPNPPLHTLLPSTSTHTHTLPHINRSSAGRSGMREAGRKSHWREHMSIPIVCGSLRPRPGEKGEMRQDISIHTVHDQIRTMKSALEGIIGDVVKQDHPGLTWLVMHSANLINIHQTGIIWMYSVQKSQR